MHLFHNVLNRKSIPISTQITNVINATKTKIADCQKRLNSDDGIKEMLETDLLQADDPYKVDYFKNQITGMQRSIRIRQRRIKKYENEITELEDALQKVKQKG